MTVPNQLARSSRHGPTVPRPLFPHLSLCVPSDPQSRGLEIPLGDLAIRRGQGRRGNGWSDDSEQRGQWRELCETQKVSLWLGSGERRWGGEKSPFPCTLYKEEGPAFAGPSSFHKSICLALALLKISSLSRNTAPSAINCSSIIGSDAMSARR